MPPTGHNTAGKENTKALSLAAGGGALAYASKKGGKLATAVHLVTSAIPDAEPLRQAARACSLRLLADVSGLCAGKVSQDTGLKHVAGCAAEIDGLLDMLSHTGYVSRESASLLRDEYAQLVRLLDEQYEAIADAASAFSPELLDTPVADERRHVVEDILKDSLRKGQTPTQSRTQKQHSGQSEKKVKERSEREETILSLIRKNGRVSVRDVADVITDCSEKTLQRELLRLVAAGTLIKEGERRWSTYKMA